MNFLLDTCVISEFTKPFPDSVVVEWVMNGIDEDECYLSVLTLGEIVNGITLLDNHAKARRLRDWFANDLLERFDGRILHIDESIAIEWGRQKAMCKKSGNPRPAADLLIAATAMVNGLTIATRNVSDFSGLDVSIFNPWDL